MNYARLMAVSLSIATAAASLVPTASAQPHIVQTDCDTLSIEPLQIKMTFAIINPDPTPVCKIRLTPVESNGTPADSCFISGCGSPPTWDCSTQTGGRAIWVGLFLPPDDTLECVDEGETQDSFSIIVRPGHCCYHVAFFTTVIPEAFHVETVCFDCDRPVQVNRGTWGKLKSLYR